VLQALNEYEAKFPLFSMIIGSCNNKKFLRHSPESVLNTDYSSYEVIIVDDGSTGGSLQLIEKLELH